MAQRAGRVASGDFAVTKAVQGNKVHLLLVAGDASAETRRIGEQLIEKELQEIEGMSFFTDKKLLPTFLNYYKRIASGERDLYM